jgi:cation transport ATPase
MDPHRPDRDVADDEREIPAPRQLSPRHDPGAPRERGLDVIGLAFGIAGFVILDRWLTGWMFPHASGWRWWVLAIATPVCVVAGRRSEKDLRKNLHKWPTRVGILVATVALLAVLVFGMAQL